MLNFSSNSSETRIGESFRMVQHPNWDSSSTEISMWVLDEPFEFGVLPMQPSSKISISLLRKVSAYIKTKNMYPTLNLISWMHISKLKLQMGPYIPWIYLRMYDILKQQMSRNDKNPGYWDFKCEQLRKGRRDKKDEFRVPAFEFLVFLYVQNSYKIMKKLSVQMMNAAKRQDDRWAIKSSEPKIQSEQLHYQYVYDNIEELVDYLLEGYKGTDELPLSILEALNLLICCTSNPRACERQSLETIVTTPAVAPTVNFNAKTQTVSRVKFVEWVKRLLKLNPWGSASSFVHAPKMFPSSGVTRKESKDASLQNRIIYNGQKPPFAWEIISNVCYQVLLHAQQQDFSNLKIHRCNNSFIYAPGIYNCLFVDKCINSTIFLGVTAKVVKFFGCTNIKVHSVSRFVIITDCIKSTYYLLTPSPPILTGSKNDSIQLGPYNTHYPTLSKDFARADFSASVSNWKEAVQIACDGTSVDTVSPIISFIPPSDFDIFTFPFELPGSTTENPVLIPDEYVEEINLRNLDFEEWKEEYLSVDVPVAVRMENDQHIMNSFRGWLSKIGHAKELDGLINLHNMLDQKSDGQGNVLTGFEFSEPADTKSQLVSLEQVLGSVHSLSLSDKDVPALVEPGLNQTLTDESGSGATQSSFESSFT